TSYPDLPHGLLDPFLDLPVHPFHSLPLPGYVSLQAPFLKAIDVRTLPPHRVERRGSDCHACRYRALSLRVVFSIKPVQPEQTVDAHLWSHVESQVDFWYILAIMSNFCDGLLIHPPSSPTARPQSCTGFSEHTSLTGSIFA
ncbi:unnamed protein product, partial [Protopolystoma xenopodis]